MIKNSQELHDKVIKYVIKKYNEAIVKISLGHLDHVEEYIEYNSLAKTLDNYNKFKRVILKKFLNNWEKKSKKLSHETIKEYELIVSKLSNIMLPNSNPYYIDDNVPIYNQDNIFCNDLKRLIDTNNFIEFADMSVDKLIEFLNELSAINCIFDTVTDKLTQYKKIKDLSDYKTIEELIELKLELKNQVDITSPDNDVVKKMFLDLISFSINRLKTDKLVLLHSLKIETLEELKDKINSSSNLDIKNIVSDVLNKQKTLFEEIKLNTLSKIEEIKLKIKDLEQYLYATNINEFTLSIDKIENIYIEINNLHLSIVDLLKELNDLSLVHNIEYTVNMDEIATSKSNIYIKYINLQELFITNELNQTAPEDFLRTPTGESIKINAEIIEHLIVSIIQKILDNIDITKIFNTELKDSLSKVPTTIVEANKLFDSYIEYLNKQTTTNIAFNHIKLDIIMSIKSYDITSFNKKIEELTTCSEEFLSPENLNIKQLIITNATVMQFYINNYSKMTEYNKCFKLFNLKDINNSIQFDEDFNFLEDLKIFCNKMTPWIEQLLITKLDILSDLIQDIYSKLKNNFTNLFHSSLGMIDKLFNNRENITSSDITKLCSQVKKLINSKNTLEKITMHFKKINIIVPSSIIDNDIQTYIDNYHNITRKATIDDIVSLYENNYYNTVTYFDIMQKLEATKLSYESSLKHSIKLIETQYKPLNTTAIYNQYNVSSSNINTDYYSLDTLSLLITDADQLKKYTERQQSIADSSKEFAELLLSDNINEDSYNNKTAFLSILLSPDSILEQNCISFKRILFNFKSLFVDVGSVFIKQYHTFFSFIQDNYIPLKLTSMDIVLSTIFSKEIETSSTYIDNIEKEIEKIINWHTNICNVNTIFIYLHDKMHKQFSSLLDFIKTYNTIKYSDLLSRIANKNIIGYSEDCTMLNFEDLIQEIKILNELQLKLENILSKNYQSVVNKLSDTDTIKSQLQEFIKYQSQILSSNIDELTQLVTTIEKISINENEIESSIEKTSCATAVTKIDNFMDKILNEQIDATITSDELMTLYKQLLTACSTNVDIRIENFKNNIQNIQKFITNIRSIQCYNKHSKCFNKSLIEINSNYELTISDAELDHILNAWSDKLIWSVERINWFYNVTFAILENTFIKYAYIGGPNYTTVKQYISDTSKMVNYSLDDYSHIMTDILKIQQLYKAANMRGKQVKVIKYNFKKIIAPRKLSIDKPTHDFIDMYNTLIDNISIELNIVQLHNYLITIYNLKDKATILINEINAYMQTLKQNIASMLITFKSSFTLENLNIDELESINDDLLEFSKLIDEINKNFDNPFINSYDEIKEKLVKCKELDIVKTGKISADIIFSIIDIYPTVVINTRSLNNIINCIAWPVKTLYNLHLLFVEKLIEANDNSIVLECYSNIQKIINSSIVDIENINVFFKWSFMLFPSIKNELTVTLSTIKDTNTIETFANIICKMQENLDNCLTLSPNIFKQLLFINEEKSNLPQNQELDDYFSLTDTLNLFKNTQSILNNSSVINLLETHNVKEYLSNPENINKLFYNLVYIYKPSKRRPEFDTLITYIKKTNTESTTKLEKLKIFTDVDTKYNKPTSYNFKIKKTHKIALFQYHENAIQNICALLANIDLIKNTNVKKLLQQILFLFHNIDASLILEYLFLRPLEKLPNASVGLPKSAAFSYIEPTIQLEIPIRDNILKIKQNLHKFIDRSHDNYSYISKLLLLDSLTLLYANDHSHEIYFDTVVNIAPTNEFFKCVIHKLLFTNYTHTNKDISIELYNLNLHNMNLSFMFALCASGLCKLLKIDFNNFIEIKVLAHSNKENFKKNLNHILSTKFNTKLLFIKLDSYYDILSIKDGHAIYISTNALRKNNISQGFGYIKKSDYKYTGKSVKNPKNVSLYILLKFWKHICGSNEEILLRLIRLLCIFNNIEGIIKQFIKDDDIVIDNDMSKTIDSDDFNSQIIVSAKTCNFFTLINTKINLVNIKNKTANMVCLIKCFEFICIDDNEDLTYKPTLEPSGIEIPVLRPSHYTSDLFNGIESTLDSIIYILLNSSHIKKLDVIHTETFIDCIYGLGNFSSSLQNPLIRQNIIAPSYQEEYGILGKYQVVTKIHEYFLPNLLGSLLIAYCVHSSCKRNININTDVFMMSLRKLCSDNISILNTICSACYSWFINKPTATCSEGVKNINDKLRVEDSVNILKCLMVNELKQCCPTESILLDLYSTQAYF